MLHGYYRILVTGGAGFIGSHLVDRLLAEDVRVSVLDNLTSGRLENVGKHLKHGSYRFVKGDVRDVTLVKDLLKDVDAIVHLAAIISVSESLDNPVVVNDVNVNGTLNLLKASVDSDVKRFIYASSSAVYGDARILPISEEHPAKPTSPYGVSKLAAENYVRVFQKVFGLEAICLRYFNVYGQRQGHSQYSGVITQFMNRLSTNSPIIVFGDGKQTRDFVHVHDIVEANMLALKTKNVSGESFNIATGVGTTIDQLAAMLVESTGKTYHEIVHSEIRRGDIKYSVADISKARKELQYDPRILLKDGLSKFART